MLFSDEDNGVMGLENNGLCYFLSIVGHRIEPSSDTSDIRPSKTSLDLGKANGLRLICRVDQDYPMFEVTAIETGICFGNSEVGNFHTSLSCGVRRIDKFFLRLQGGMEGYVPAGTLKKGMKRVEIMPLVIHRGHDHRV